MENKKIIANPLYDTAFKYLMENMETARFFIETIIGEQVVDIYVAPQERVVTIRKKVGEEHKDTMRLIDSVWKKTFKFHVHSLIQD